MAAFNPNSVPNNQRYKLIFYVPRPSLEAVKSGVFAAGAGTYPGGKYTSCSFETNGVGQFLPDAERGANPTIGKLQDDGSIQYRLEKVEEVKCEVLCIGRSCLEKAVEALKRTHPYEEPAYEAYKIEDI
ncbi:hypothetical protein EDC01DRAFT_24467 [Geopyxis carbonaria]|nr:hypothetical protein EDC01DRAFT_24467 [Geopyxis carbonaria]